MERTSPRPGKDRNENKHYAIAKRMLERGGRRDIFLGTRECQGYIEPCIFGLGKGHYDDVSSLDLGLMEHGITYADENGKGVMQERFWHPVMQNGKSVLPPGRMRNCARYPPAKDEDLYAG